MGTSARGTDEAGPGTDVSGFDRERIDALPAWKLEDAKARFSEVVRRAQSEGPQRVTGNVQDVRDTGATLLNPWIDAPRSIVIG